MYLLHVYPLEVIQYGDFHGYVSLRESIFILPLGENYCL